MILYMRVCRARAKRPRHVRTDAGQHRTGFYFVTVGARAAPDDPTKQPRITCRKSRDEIPKCAFSDRARMFLHARTLCNAFTCVQQHTRHGVIRTRNTHTQIMQWRDKGLFERGD